MSTVAILSIAGLTFLHLSIPLFFRCVLRWNISYAEYGIQIGVGVLSVALLTGLSMTANIRDVEIHNGRVLDKERVKVSCEHSYECFCTTRTNSDGTTYRTCQTCWRHSHDYDWRVMTTVGDLNIQRVDSQGKDEPPRWTKVIRGEPAADSKVYKNYVKAAPDSIFSLRETYADRWEEVPYPKVHDYYRFNRVINNAGYRVGNMNDKLNQWLTKAGWDKQVNVIVITTKEASNEYGEFIRQTWLGGKKNDVVVVVNPGDGNIKWIRAFSWSKNTTVHSVIEETSHMGELTENIIYGVNRYYVRRPMEEFEYLKDDIRPPGWAVILNLLFNVVLSISLSVYMHRNYVA